MTEVRIIYIDDNVEEMLARYIDQIYCKIPYIQDSSEQPIRKIFSEVKFIGANGYESLLKDNQVRSANVILVDNRLFEESTAGNGKFSGKQFKIILRKLLPYVEVIIITQDPLLVGANITHKFSGRHGENSEDYYNEELAPILNRAIEEFIEFEKLAEDLRHSSDVEKLLIEKILQSLQGDDSYDQLTKADIDSLIASFKELKDGCR